MSMFECLMSGRDRRERGPDDRGADSRQAQDRGPHHALADRPVRRSAANITGNEMLCLWSCG